MNSSNLSGNNNSNASSNTSLSNNFVNPLLNWYEMQPLHMELEILLSKIELMEEFPNKYAVDNTDALLQLLQRAQNIKNELKAISNVQIYMPHLDNTVWPMVKFFMEDELLLDQSPEDVTAFVNSLSVQNDAEQGIINAILRYQADLAEIRSTNSATRIQARFRGMRNRERAKSIRSAMQQIPLSNYYQRLRRDSANRFYGNLMHDQRQKEALRGNIEHGLIERARQENKQESTDALARLMVEHGKKNRKNRKNRRIKESVQKTSNTMARMVDQGKKHRAELSDIKTKNIALESELREAKKRDEIESELITTAKKENRAERRAKIQANKADRTRKHMDARRMAESKQKKKKDIEEQATRMREKVAATLIAQSSKQKEYNKTMALPGHMHQPTTWPGRYAEQKTQSMLIPPYPQAKNSFPGLRVKPI